MSVFHAGNNTTVNATSVTETTIEVAKTPRGNRSGKPVAPKQNQPDTSKQKECMEWRTRGYSYDAIGEFLGLSGTVVRKHCIAALAHARAELMETAGEALQIELSRVERMITVYEKIIFAEDKVVADEYVEVTDEKTGVITKQRVEPKLSKQQIEAAYIVDKLLDRKAKMLGFFRTDDTKVKEPLPWSDDD